MDSAFYAKKLKDGRNISVKQHLCAVAENARAFASAFGEADAGFLAGLFHDFGKYSGDVQGVLAKTRIHVDHAVCGAAV